MPDSFNASQIINLSDVRVLDVESFGRVFWLSNIKICVCSSLGSSSQIEMDYGVLAPRAFSMITTTGFLFLHE